MNDKLGKLKFQDMCLGEQAEYEGEYELDIYGAYEDCDCSQCQALRDE